ncbi:MAG: SpoIIE family protein phosphatase [Anaerolineales bacterium]|nr:SpoIIE family protein phosphatase [Anaerolineales bacterium]
MSINLLSKIPLFSSLPTEELDGLLTLLGTLDLQSGEILFNEGDLGEAFYVVLEGELEILKLESGVDELLLNVLQAGEYLGEMSLIMPGGHRTATARARGTVTLLSMNRAQFLEMNDRHPEISNWMVKVLSQRLDATNVATFRDLKEKNRQLQTAYDELKAAQAQIIEKERLERELQVAADIQLSILPDELPQPAGVNFGARMVPARQVGGDFYDVFTITEKHIGVLIGDVADKGVPSALFMARVHALIMAEADMDLLPGEVLRLVNKHITRLQKSSQFVTVLYGILNLETDEFSYARAGHEPPLILHADGTVERIAHSSGMAIGLWETVTLDERAVQLTPGDTLVMYTDGMTDCRNPAGESFGLERIKNLLSGLTKGTAQQVCDTLLKTLQNYQNGAKQDDDVTLVAVQIK